MCLGDGRVGIFSSYQKAIYHLGKQKVVVYLPSLSCSPGGWLQLHYQEHELAAMEEEQLQAGLAAVAVAECLEHVESLVVLDQFSLQE